MRWIAFVFTAALSFLSVAVSAQVKMTKNNVPVACSGSFDQQGNVVYYHPKYFGGRARNPVIEGKDTVAVLDLDACVEAETTAGRRFVVLEKGTELRWHLNQDNSLGTPFAINECGNGVFEIVYPNSSDAAVINRQATATATATATTQAPPQPVPAAQPGLTVVNNNPPPVINNYYNQDPGVVVVDQPSRWSLFTIQPTIQFGGYNSYGSYGGYGGDCNGRNNCNTTYNYPGQQGSPRGGRTGGYGGSPRGGNTGGSNYNYGNGGGSNTGGYNFTSGQNSPRPRLGRPARSR